METKKNPKYDLNKKSLLFFQLGMIIMLLICLIAIEHKSYDSDITQKDIIVVNDDLIQDIPITEQLTTPPPPPPIASIPEFLEIIEDEDEIEESIIESTETDQNKEIEDIVEIDEIVEVEEEEDITVPFAVIENVPIYPGCEKVKSNAKRKLCLSDKVSKLVQKNFNKDLAGDLGLTGVQRIFVQFKIDKNGQVANVKARAPHPSLEKEAIRVVKLLPIMTPGRQREKPVGVLYSLPILFKVETSI